MNCRICQNEAHLYLKNVPTVGLYNIKTTKMYNHYRCNNCDVVFVHPIPPAQELDEVYSKSDYYTTWEKDHVKNTTIRFQNDYKKLAKRYRTLADDLIVFESVITAKPLGFGKNFAVLVRQKGVVIIKARLFCRSLKRNSLRIIYAYTEQSLESGNHENQCGICTLIRAVRREWYGRIECL